MTDRISKIIDVAAGREQADVVLKNCNIVNVFTQEIVQGNIAICGDKIAGIGDYSGKHEIDINGCYAIPGLIDSHVHIESAMIVPEQFARAVVPKGTTTVIADPHEITNVCGLDGISFILERSRDLPLNVYIMLPSCVPATPFETSGTRLGAQDLVSLLENERVLGLGEMMDYVGVVSADNAIIEKLTSLNGKIIDGHAPQLGGKSLNAYISAGIRTDHECTTVEEMAEKIRSGLHIQIREGSAARDLKTLIKGVNERNMRRCSFCTDDRHLDAIIKEGHIDNCIRQAVKNGMEPVKAVIMATLNTAECYGLEKLGAIAPGYAADIVVTDNLEDFNIIKVIKSGRLVAENGILTEEICFAQKGRLHNTVRIDKISKEMFDIKLKSENANVISVQPGSLITRKEIRKVKTDGGLFVCSDSIDVVKLAVVERHRATGNIGLGLLENLNIKNMAIASTVAHDSHNLIVAGDNDADMLAAVQELYEKGGGITICSRGEVIKTLPLPIAGLLSDRPFEEVAGELAEMLDIVYKMGVNKEFEPFMILSFLALPVIPEIRLTDRGLFDVESFSFINIS
ncbi:MAG: adenine deaminase [Acetivibrionales bacterium]|jgi:adenine deaminase